MAVGMLAGSFAESGPDVISISDRAQAVAFSERLKTYGFYRPNQTCIVILTCKTASCNARAKDTTQKFRTQCGLSPELPLFAQSYTTGDQAVAIKDHDFDIAQSSESSAHLVHIKDLL